MTKLIREVPKSKYQGASQDWLVNDRFEICVFDGKKRNTFYVDDVTHEVNGGDLLLKIIDHYKLLEDKKIEICNAIDTCGIFVPHELRDEVFKLLEKYLENVPQDVLKELARKYKLERGDF